MTIRQPLAGLAGEGSWSPLTACMRWSAPPLCCLPRLAVSGFYVGRPGDVKGDSGYVVKSGQSGKYSALKNVLVSGHNRVIRRKLTGKGGCRSTLPNWPVGSPGGAPASFRRPRGQRSGDRRRDTPREMSWTFQDHEVCDSLHMTRILRDHGTGRALPPTVRDRGNRRGCPADGA